MKLTEADRPKDQYPISVISAHLRHMAMVDVTDLDAWSKRTGIKFHINFLYALSKTLNSKDDYRMAWLWETREMICYDRIHPTQYVFHEDMETCTPVYTAYREDYDAFYREALADVEKSKADE